jgi:hypothetical protein
MPFIPNIAFTSLIKINGRLHEFNFRRRAENCYDADTNDERGNRYFFRMVLQQGEVWVIQDDKVPEWIQQHESTIGAAIQNDQPARINHTHRF